MVAYRRNFLPGGTFFFTVALADRRSSALIDYVASLRTAFRLTRKEHPFSIDAIVILPDHLHAMFTLPPEDSDFSGRWRRIKSLFTRQVAAQDLSTSHNDKGEYGLWQRRFWEHTIRNETDFARHADYIHYNPVKHGLVSQVVDWRYSSFHRYVRQGTLPSDWGGKSVFPTRGFGEPKPSPG
jgi:putative transposase